MVDAATPTQPMVAMTNLARPWPLGLNRRTAWVFAAGFIALIGVLHLLDRPLTEWAAGLPVECETVVRSEYGK